MLHLLGTFVANLFKWQRPLDLENLFLWHQLNIALRRAPHLRLRGGDRALLVWMTWLWPSLLGSSRVVQPDTILRWHRSRGRQGRPRVGRELRALCDEAVDGELQINDRLEHAALEAPARELGEQTLDRVESR
jgi:hypothetical protein